MKKTQNNNPNADVLPSASHDHKPMLGDVFLCYLTMPDGRKLWYGTHRADGHNFKENIFAGYKPNAYKLSKEQAELVCREKNCQMIPL